MRCVRIVTRRGEVGLTPLAPHPSLAAWWEHFRNMGQIIGEHWGCPFDAIEHARIVDVPQELERAQVRDPHLQALENTIARGAFRPPFET